MGLLALLLRSIVTLVVGVAVFALLSSLEEKYAWEHRKFQKYACRLFFGIVTISTISGVYVAELIVKAVLK